MELNLSFVKFALEGWSTALDQAVWRANNRLLREGVVKEKDTRCERVELPIEEPGEIIEDELPSEEAETEEGLGVLFGIPISLRIENARKEVEKIKNAKYVTVEYETDIIASLEPVREVIRVFDDAVEELDD